MLTKSFLRTLHPIGITGKAATAYLHQYDAENGFYDKLENYLQTDKYGLTTDEALAIWGYSTRLFYKKLNRSLRRNGFNDRTSPISKLLISGLKKLPRHSGPAYRVMELHGRALSKYLTLAKTQRSFTEQQFLSCGDKQAAAAREHEDKNIFFYYGTITAYDISDLADGIRFRGYERKELLAFPPKTFRNDEFFKDSATKKYYIRLTEE